MRLLWLTVVISACSVPAPKPDAGSPFVCTAVEVTECPTPAPTYQDVKPILIQRCEVCHWGEPGGPWPLTTYHDVSDWQAVVRDEIVRCSMPPLDDGGIPLTLDERRALMTWIRCGLPE